MYDLGLWLELNNIICLKELRNTTQKSESFFRILESNRILSEFESYSLPWSMMDAINYR